MSRRLPSPPPEDFADANVDAEGRPEVGSDGEAETDDATAIMVLVVNDET